MTSKYLASALAAVVVSQLPPRTWLGLGLGLVIGLGLEARANGSLAAATAHLRQIVTCAARSRANAPPTAPAVWCAEVR